jgi:myo-inositol-1(or 4)-monophosphatase
LQVPEPFKADAELLFDAVHQAGSLAMTMLRQRVRRWSKPDGTPVTEADMKVDALLSGLLRARRPGYGWLSEESQDDQTRTHCENCWIVDPIDGTRAFSLGKTEWCVGAALVQKGRPVVAAIYQPVPELLFTAVLGAGAWLNGKSIRVTDGASLAGARLIGNRKSLSPLLDDGIVADMSGELPLLLRLAQVAAGEAAATISVGPKNDWDLAAGDLLVHEAGGRVTDLDGATYKMNRHQSWQNGMAAAAPTRHAIALERLKTT